MIKPVSDSLLKCGNREHYAHSIQKTMDIKEKQEEIDLQKYWLILKRRWLPASIIFSSVVALGAIASLLQKPTYEAGARLLFQTSRASLLTGLLREENGNNVNDLGRLETLSRESNPLDTQAEIVRSLPIAQATIEALNLKNDEGKPLEPEALLKRLTVKEVAGTDILQISYQSHNPKETATVVNKIVDLFIRSNIQSNRAEPAAAREFIAAQLPKTELAVREADQALREFKEKNSVLVLEKEAEAAVTSISALKDEIARTQAQLADVTAQSQELQGQIKTDPQQALLYANLSQSAGVQDVLTQFQQAQRELTVQKTRFVSGPAIAKLEEKVAALDALLQERVRQVAGNRQQVGVGNLQIGDTGKQLVFKLAEVETQRVGLIDRLNILASSYNSYRDRARNIPSLEKTQRELERRLDAAQKTYEALLTRLQAIQVAENQNIGNTRIVARALIPKKPLASKRALILGGAGFAGLLLGIVFAFALDLLDRSVKTLKEAKELFGYTVLGVIPAYNPRSDKLLSKHRSDLATPRVISRELPYSPLNEAFQMLQANLKFSTSDHTLKTIVVTSAVMGEGKSFIVANLADTVAQMGQRVLMIDADLRHPTQHHIWEVVSSKGLSNILVEQVDIAEAIQEVAPNLFLLPAGVIPPNPIALLDSNRMEQLVKLISGTYDFVIFDTPPLEGKADAAVLGKIVDSILLVVRPGVVDSSRAQAAKEFLTQSGQDVLGMVINGVNVKNEPDSYFYYTQDHMTNRDRKYQSLNIPVSLFNR